MFKKEAQIRKNFSWLSEKTSRLLLVLMRYIHILKITFSGRIFNCLNADTELKACPSGELSCVSLAFMVTDPGASPGLVTWCITQSI